MQHRTSALLDNRTVFRHANMGTTNLLHVSGGFAGYSARVKTYPDGSQDIMVCTRNIFRESGWEESSSRRAHRIRDSSEEPEERSCDTTGRALRRARAQVRELAFANDFSLFVTLTLNGELVDRYDMAAITKKLNVWLDNQVRRRGLAYVLVPERHKDGAIHFHGLFNDALEVVDSGHTDKEGHTVYNLPRWSLGFTTAIRLYGEREKAIGYVTKYIGKQGEKPGGRWYYSGGSLRRPEVTYCDMDFREAMEQPGAFSFSVPEANAQFCMYRIEGGCNDD